VMPDYISLLFKFEVCLFLMRLLPFENPGQFVWLPLPHLGGLGGGFPLLKESFFSVSDYSLVFCDCQFPCACCCGLAFGFVPLPFTDLLHRFAIVNSPWYRFHRSHVIFFFSRLRCIDLPLALIPQPLPSRQLLRHFLSTAFSPFT